MSYQLVMNQIMFMIFDHYLLTDNQDIERLNAFHLVIQVDTSIILPFFDI